MIKSLDEKIENSKKERLCSISLQTDSPVDEYLIRLFYQTKEYLRNTDYNNNYMIYT